MGGLTLIRCLPIDQVGTGMQRRKSYMLDWGHHFSSCVQRLRMKSRPRKGLQVMWHCSRLRVPGTHRSRHRRQGVTIRATSSVVCDVDCAFHGIPKMASVHAPPQAAGACLHGQDQGQRQKRILIKSFSTIAKPKQTYHKGPDLLNSAGQPQLLTILLLFPLDQNSEEYAYLRKSRESNI